MIEAKRDFRRGRTSLCRRHLGIAVGEITVDESRRGFRKETKEDEDGDIEDREDG